MCLERGFADNMLSLAGMCPLSYKFLQISTYARVWGEGEVDINGCIYARSVVYNSSINSW